MNENATNVVEALAEAPARSEPASGGLASRLGSALAIGIIAATLIGVIEVLVGSVRLMLRFESLALPWWLMPGVLGRTILTHLLLWVPLLLLIGVIHRIVAKGQGRYYEPLLMGLVLVGGGILMSLAEARAVDRLNVGILAAGIAGSALLAVLGGFALKGLRNTLGAPGYARARNITAVVCGLIIIGTWIAFMRSPWIPPIEPHANIRANTSNASAARKPNVLWIVWDTVRADRLSLNGFDGPTTPFLERLGQESLVFDRAMSAGIWTLPSHASMFTGLPSRQHGAKAVRAWVDGRHETAAELLSDAGYETVCYTNNPLISDSTNLNQGFGRTVQAHFVRDWGRCWIDFVMERWGVTPPMDWLDRDFGAGVTNAMVKRWLDHHGDGGKPFFMFINYMDAHLPYVVPAEYRRMFMNDEQVRRSYELRYSVFGDVVRAMNDRFNERDSGFVSESDREILRRQYDAGIRYLDAAVEDLWNELSRRGLDENTVVIVTSDHGEYLDDHGMWSHVFQTYDEVCRIPLLIHDPIGEEHGRVSAPVQHVDLLPTVLHLALGPGEYARTAGARVITELATDPENRRIAVTEYNGPAPAQMDWLKESNDPQKIRRGLPQTTVTDARFKLITTRDGLQELYDIISDPKEQRDLSRSRFSEVKRLERLLKEWEEAVPEYVPSAEDEPGEMSEATREALRGLGYVGEEDPES